MNQETLIEECKLNNKRAQLELYRKYNQAMFNVAMRMLRNTDNAEDITQDSFINAFKNIHQFKGKVSIGAWIKKIVIHKSLNFIKKKELETISYNKESIENLKIENEDNWEFEGEIVLEDVKNNIEKLPTKYKFVLMLYLIEGYDHEEISEILNISVIASRTQLMRGKIKLRKLLKQEGYGSES
mgnify:CR=1 FL=1